MGVSVSVPHRGMLSLEVARLFSANYEISNVSIECAVEFRAMNVWLCWDGVKNIPDYTVFIFFYHSYFA